MSSHLNMEDDVSQKNGSTLEQPLDIDEGYWTALLVEADNHDPEPEAISGGNGWSDHNVVQSEETQPGPSIFAAEHDWMLAQHTYDSDEAIDLHVTGYNRGGLLVSWNTLRGFVPASQLVDFPVDIGEVARSELLAKYVGQELKLRIIELDIDSNRLILSQRAAQVEPGQRADVLNKLEAGTICEGIVTNLCDFGAFIDLGGIEGLIHISELSWGRVGHPRDVLSRGQTVKAYIMSIDPGDERIALSLKRLQPDPWSSVSERYEVGQIVEGRITNVVDFGAFACIEEGLEGLIHISELAEGQFLHPRNVVAEGEVVHARILNIDGPARRLGLSLRYINHDGNGDQITNLDNHQQR